MIGQEHNLCYIHMMVVNGFFPRFLTIAGPKGSGKKTLAKHIGELYKNSYVAPDVKISTIRDIIDNSYKQKTEMVYIIPDIDGMSKEAQNAILKVTEEPPNKARFVMTVEDMNNILSTIKSRAMTLFMEPYSKDELLDYITSIIKTNDTDLMLDVCETPGEIDTFIKCGGEEFYNFVDKVVDNVGNVETSNALKILLQLDMKDEGKGYDVPMFLKVFMRCAFVKSQKTKDRFEAFDYLRMMPPTSEALTRLKVRGANKNMILTDWIFNIRATIDRKG